MVLIRHKSSANRRETVLEENRRRRTPASTSASSFAEMAGGTTADVAAVACLAPYGVANLLVLAAYRAPADLYRKAIRERRRRRLVKSGMLHTRSLSADDDLFSSTLVVPSEEDEAITEVELRELEEKMWEHFSSTGFWRSASRKEP